MSFAGYKITSMHCFCDNIPVKMYFICNLPFAFDALEEHEKQDKWILSECAMNIEYTMEDMYKISDYLIMEEAHPLLFELPLLNPELLPDDSVS